jgi:hypothetical protein
MTIPYDPADWVNPVLNPLYATPAYTQLPLCIDPGQHYFQLDHIKRDTAVCTRCGLIRKATA